MDVFLDLITSCIQIDTSQNSKAILLQFHFNHSRRMGNEPPLDLYIGAEVACRELNKSRLRIMREFRKCLLFKSPVRHTCSVLSSHW